MIRPAKRTTLYKDVINQIVEMIKNGNWSQGERIPGEIELARQFQVSRNCVREALKALAHAEILEARPGLGTFLGEEANRKVHAMELGRAERDENYFLELLQARLMIEPHLAEMAAERATESDIAELEQVVNRSVEAIRSNTYSVQVGFEFHMVIMRIAKNRVLERFYDSIADEMKLQRGALIFSHMGQADLFRELREHEAVFECIRKRDGKGARRLMEKHLKKAISLMNKPANAAMA